jgi:hypothetical protein
MEGKMLLNRGDSLLVDTDFRSLVASHAVDIILIFIFGIKVLFVSGGSLRVKLSGLLILLGVFYIGQAVRTQFIGPDTPVYWSFAYWIGIRLIAIKVIFTVIDWNDA